MKVINVSSGTDWGQFHHENAMSTVFIFLLGALGGSSKANRGQIGDPKGELECDPAQLNLSCNLFLIFNGF